MTTSLKLAEKLFEAIQTNDFNLVSNLLTSGANPNRLLLNGVTPFHLAVGADSTSCYKYVSEILTHNGNPNVYDTEGHTPLHVAAIWGKADCLRLMLQYGGDINLTDKEGKDVEWFAKDNHNCMVILNDYLTEQSLDSSDLGQFSYNLRKINLSQVIPRRKVLESPICSDCGKRKSLSRNLNNNFLTPVEQKSTCKESHEIHLEQTIKDNTALLANSPHSKKVGLSEKDAKVASQYVSQDEVVIPLKGFNPNNISLRTGIDVTSPDNCYMFIRKHSSPDETLDKTVRLKANTSDVDDSVDVQYICQTPRRPAQSFESSLSSSGSCSDFVITEEQRRQMLFDTRANHANAVHSSGDISPSYNPQDVSYTRIAADDSVFSLADTTVALDETESMAETLPINESCLDQPNACQSDENLDIGEQATSNFKETRQRLQSTCIEDVSHILPKCFDISLISDEDQIFLYSDSEGNSLIEHRRRPSASSYGVEEILSPPIKLSVSQDSPQNSTVLSDSTIIYDWKTLLHNESVQEIVGRKYEPDGSDDTIVIPDDICQLSNKQLRAKLVGHGLNPGPIAAARALYMKKLCLLERGFHVDNGAAKGNGKFSHEMRSLLAGKPLPPSVADDDRSVRLQFDNPPPSGQWRGGNAKDSFNYLLLDPRVTDMLPNRAGSISESESLRVFAGAVFYVGKGKKARPYAHFKEALSKRGVASPSPKLQHIHEIWRAGCGVVSLHIFQNAIACEAFTREAAIIEALGIDNLTNGVRGKRYGIAADWTAPRVRRYGAFLVLAAMRMLLLEGERQIRPHHISK